MFLRCLNDKEFKQAIGIAIESRRLDVIERAVQSGDSQELLAYVLETSMTTVDNVELRNQILRLLVKLYRGLSEPDYISISQCLLHLDDVDGVVDLLKKLVEKDEYHSLVAFQIAFDLEENATQEFLQKVLGHFPAATTPVKSENAMETDDAKPEATPFDKIRTILSGELSIKLNLEFLYRNNKTDLLILKSSKLLESKSSMFHSAITFANAFMNAGTTSDEFLRNNLDWLARATNWAKFSATAALGVIHKGQITQGHALLAPYLPKEGVSVSGYQEGGALYALGLIHANHGVDVLDYLVKALKSSQNEVVQHGACLGLGVAGMAIGSESIYEHIKNILFGDNAVAGEAAGLSMGLVMLGTGSQTAIQDMLQYAHETQHGKIIRGLALGMAMIVYGKEDLADSLIEQLCSDKDPLIRYGGMYAVAMAYAGTGHNKAIKRLLHVAVSDVDDDVRRAAVTALGFILFKTPEKVPRVVQLLAESFNPHVRYGAALALGVACAGTGLASAVEILEPLTKDSVSFVKQGAFVALAMIFMQTNEVRHPKVTQIRELYSKTLNDKYGDAMSKFGATLAQGGRNVTISMQSRSQHPSMPAIVGMALFTQFWYWYPLAHMLCLSFTPTAIIGLNKNLELPKFEFVSGARPSMFAYPPPTKPPVVETVEKVATAVLSTTAKAKARAKKKEEDAMETDEKKEAEQQPPTPAPETPKEEKPEKRKKKKEDDFEVLNNLSRVVPQQAQFITFKDDSRYVPVKKGHAFGGIMIMHDKTPEKEQEIIPYTIPAAKEPTKTEETAEPAPPEPFEYVEA